MMKFKVGDLVIGVGQQDDVNITGLTGVIMFMDQNNPFINYESWGVKFDKPHEKFHSLHGKIEVGYGWFCQEGTIERFGGYENE